MTEIDNAETGGKEKKQYGIVRRTRLRTDKGDGREE
jgi:hypothetical protein